MKKFFTSALVSIMLCTPVFADSVVTVYSNGNKTAENGIIVDGRTMVPVRGVFEYMGYTVDWDNETKTATLLNSEKDIKITVSRDDKVFYVNGDAITPDVPQQIVDGRFMLPLRAVGEAANADISWDNETKTAKISEKAAESITIFDFGGDDKSSDDDNTSGNKDFSITGVSIEVIDPESIDGDLINDIVID